MKSEEIKKLADDARNNAKMLGGQMLEVPEGCCVDAPGLFVDSIIACATLEIAALQAKAQEGEGE